MMVELLTGAMPWVTTCDGRGFMANPKFLDFPDWGFPAIHKLTLRCLQSEPKERPSFSEILAIVKVKGLVI